MVNYSRIEWICNNTSTSTMALNSYPSSTTKIEVDAAFLNNTHGGIIFMASYGNSGWYTYYGRVNSSSLSFGSYSTVWVYDYHNYIDQERRTYTFGNRYIAVNNVTTASEVVQSHVTFNGKLIWFPWVYANYDYKSVTQKVYEIKIYDGDVLIRDYIPVIRWYDRKVGLLDTESQEFIEAPTDYTRGAILEGYTTNMEIRVDYDPSESIHYFITDNSNNFQIVDDFHESLATKDQTLTALVSKITNIYATNDTDKKAIWAALKGKVDLLSDADLVLKILIDKLDADYFKKELDDIFATSTDLAARIEAISATLLANYYTKAEVDAVVEAGSSTKLDNYYTKTEIDEKIPKKEDLSILEQFFLESRPEYYPFTNELAQLNGKGD